MVHRHRYGFDGSHMVDIFLDQLGLYRETVHWKIPGNGVLSYCNYPTSLQASHKGLSSVKRRYWHHGLCLPLFAAPSLTDQRWRHAKPSCAPPPAELLPSHRLCSSSSQARSRTPALGLSANGTSSRSLSAAIAADTLCSFLRWWAGEPFPLGRQRLPWLGTQKAKSWRWKRGCRWRWGLGRVCKRCPCVDYGLVFRR